MNAIFRISNRAIRGVLAILFCASGVFGQSLQDDIENIFNEVLSPENLFLGEFEHGRHFLPSSVSSSQATINSFGNFISANVSSFPLSSTTAGLTFDFSTGVPVSTTTSLGPIFSERAQTLGSGRLNLGFNFSYLTLNKLRGVNTKDIRFTFTHQDIGGPTGNNPSGIIGDDRFGTEFDTIDLFMNLDFNATILAFLATFGITNRLDIGVAVPFVNVAVEGQPVARMNPLTALARQDTATHFWGDPSDPQLTFRPTPIKDDATGFGDISIRLKYNFLRGKTIDLAALAEYRPPTGDEEDFLGAGEASYKGQVIISSIIGDFAPHLNLAYEKRGNKFDRDEIEVFAGYDQKVFESLTLAIDFLGEFEIGEEIEELKFPEPITLQGDSSMFGNWQYFRQEVSITNFPNFKYDHIMNASVGLKFSPKENLLIIGNVFVPLNDGGLRSDVIPTLGFEFNF